MTLFYRQGHLFCMQSNNTFEKEISLFFRKNQSVIRASSPGRLDVMGGIADYSGSLVLQKTIRQKAFIALAANHDNYFKVKSLNIDSSNEIITPIHEIPQNYTEAQFFFKKNKENAWIAYILGSVLVFCQEQNLPLKGLDILIYSEVPVGKGVSSSASIEVATMKALSEFYRCELVGTLLPTLAQKAENLVVGAPCGLMDQLASFFGFSDQLLPIICQPDLVQNPVKIPEGIHFIGIDSGVKHEVGGASYGEVRTAAFMGYSMIANAIQDSEQSDLPYSGYLSNISISELNNKFLSVLHDINGEKFLEQYKKIIDPISTIDPNYFYRVIPCTKHPIEENFRVNLFLAFIKQCNQENIEELLPLMGELMYQSHESYNACGLGNKNTDRIVQIAKEFGKNKGIYGAKITGGGSGGTVCLMVYGNNGLNAAKEIFKQYQSESKFEHLLFIN